MKYTISPLAFALGSSALAIRGSSQQCVQLSASGGASGVLGQLSDGQNRIGGGYGAACYCLDESGGFTDSSGRGCILTPPTTQFQCDVGASPTNGFAINGGSVTYNGNSKFYACPVNDNGEYNVYSQPVSGQDKCVEITLGAGQSCGGASPKPSTPSPPSSSNCPADLNGEYQYPHLIIPVSSSQPSNAPGTSYNGEANGDVCSLFNFDIPPSYSGHTCTLVFLFPEQKDLETSSYTISGSGGLAFSQCETTASQMTSWDNKGTCNAVMTVENVAPGNSYTIMSGSCAAGKTVTYQMCATGSLSLEYFQDYNPSPIGAYVREC